MTTKWSNVYRKKSDGIVRPRRGRTNLWITMPYKRLIPLGLCYNADDCVNELILPETRLIKKSYAFLNSI